MALEFLSKLIHLGQRRSHCRIRPESHSARLISSQSRSISSLFQLVWKLTESEYDFVEGFREILLFSIENIAVSAIQFFQISRSNFVHIIVLVEPKIEDGCGVVATVRRHRPGR